ncbi:MAG: hypothetical protein JNK22_04525 [Rhodocyclaceae bacterium]|nr:hypothetical protein [Rhodocyclaceae bacterium]
MRKTIIGHETPAAPEPHDQWLDLDLLARVEVSSEEWDHPVEAALLPGRDGGWRAAEAGEQILRILFDDPRSVRRVLLVFEERDRERTQEFVLRWSGDGGRSYRDLVRQQFNFSPWGSVREVEDYGLDLTGVTGLELRVVPDISRGHARATLASLRLA